jgi:hypothetical protein
VPDYREGTAHVDDNLAILLEVAARPPPPRTGGSNRPTASAAPIAMRPRALAPLSAARATGFLRGAGRLAPLRNDPDPGSLRDRPNSRLLLMDLAMPADPFAPSR